MMADMPFSRNEIISLVVRLSLVSAVTYMSIKWLMNQVDPTNNTKKKAKKRAQEQLRRYRLDIEIMCESYEMLKVMLHVGVLFL